MLAPYTLSLRVCVSATRQYCIKMATSYTDYLIAATVTTLNVLKGHSPIASLSSARHAVPLHLQSLLFETECVGGLLR